MSKEAPQKDSNNSSKQHYFDCNYTTINHDITYLLTPEKKTHKTKEEVNEINNTTMERVCYKVHDKFTKTALRNTTPIQRSIIENTILFLAVISFSGVILCHRTFVYLGGAIKSQALSSKGWNIPSMCLNSIEGIQRDVNVTHVLVYDSFLDASANANVDVDGLQNSDSVEKKHPESFCHSQESSSNQNDKLEVENGGNLKEDRLECKYSTSNQHKIEQNFQKNSFVVSIQPLTGRLQSTLLSTNHDDDMSNKKDLDQEYLKMEQLKQFLSQHRITYSFSSTKGFLYLPPDTLSSRNISSQYVIISSDDKRCFSDDPLLNYAGQTISGLRDTISLNWILGFWNGRKGYIHIEKNGLIIDLEEYLNEYSFRWPTSKGTTTVSSTTTSSQQQSDTNQKVIHAGGGGRWHHNFVIFKVGVLISSLFLFFTTTTLVSFTLRETQNRMLHFTFQLQKRIQEGQPYSGLIITHVIHNMVFVPIMIGILLFLTDCYYNGDKFLAIIILSGVWICEVFSAIRYVNMRYLF